LMEELERVRRAMEEMQEMQGQELQQGDVTVGSAAGANASTSARRRRANGRRSLGSLMPSGSGSVLEDVSEQSEERVAFEARVEELRAEIQRCAGERDEVQRAFEQVVVERERLGGEAERRLEELDDERKERDEERKRYEKQMKELEGGAQQILKELERRAEDAERRVREMEGEKEGMRRDMERMVEALDGEREAANERAERAERALEGGKDLGAEVTDANERAATALGELRGASIKIKDLESEVRRGEVRIEGLEREVKAASQTIRTLEDDLQKKWDEVAKARNELDTAQAAHTSSQHQLDKANACIAELEDDAGAALGRIQTLEDQLLRANEQLGTSEQDVEEAEDRIRELETEVDRANTLAKQMEAALEVAETKLSSDSDKIGDLKAKIASLERQAERSVSMSHSKLNLDRNAEIEALEAELDDAHRELARLSTQLQQSPARKAIEGAKDAKIAMLEQEREELLDRVRTLRTTNANASISLQHIQSMTGTQNYQTPGKKLSMSGISPAHRHVLNMTLKTPKTPGGPLRDVGFLMTMQLLMLR
jgi:chromosome segregation ATPase